jgi:hypothetical protein
LLLVAIILVGILKWLANPIRIRSIFNVDPRDRDCHVLITGLSPWGARPS